MPLAKHGSYLPTLRKGILVLDRCEMLIVYFSSLLSFLDDFLNFWTCRRIMFLIRGNIWFCCLRMSTYGSFRSLINNLRFTIKFCWNICLSHCSAHIQTCILPEVLSMKLDEHALNDVMKKLFKNYKRWCKYLGRRSSLWWVWSI